MSTDTRVRATCSADPDGPVDGDLAMLLASERATTAKLREELARLAAEWSRVAEERDQVRFERDRLAAELRSQGRRREPPPRTGSELRRWRVERGLTQRQAAHLLGVGHATIERAEARAGERPLGLRLRRAIGHMLQATYEKPSHDAGDSGPDPQRRSRHERQSK